MRSYGILRLVCTAVITMALYTTPAFSKSSNEEELRIAACILQASLGHPWLEKTLWGLRDQEAGWVGAEVRNSNGSHDLGPLQCAGCKVDILVSPALYRKLLDGDWRLSQPDYVAAETLSSFGRSPYADEIRRCCLSPVIDRT